MEINNTQLLTCLYNKVNTAAFGTTPEVLVKTPDYSGIDLLSSTADGQQTYDVDSIGSTITDKELVSRIQKALPDAIKTVETKYSTTYKDLSASEISNIKQVIYNLHHKTTTDAGSGTDSDGNTGTNTDNNTGDNTGTNTGTNTDDDDSPSENPKSFISDFGDTYTMFEYLNGLDSSITKETGLSKSKLVALTQNDDWEDSNYDFFGSLNRIFDELDTNGDDTLSYEEIKAFIGAELGEDISEYEDKVTEYADQIQTDYESLSATGKLQFAIDKAREYLEAMGMTEHIKALDHLLSQTDTHNSIKIGNIAIADLNEDSDGTSITLGCYIPSTYQASYEYNGKPYKIHAFASDEDTETSDLGITLDISYLNGTWYELVDTLVHELTHATGSQYLAQDDEGYAYINDFFTGIQGYITDTEYKELLDAWNNDTMTEEQYMRLVYLSSCLWGEYAAYQADADYVDSIAGDVYDTYTENSYGQYTGGMSTAVSGSNEKSRIENHISELYDPKEDGTYEVYPDYQWWSYA